MNNTFQLHLIDKYFNLIKEGIKTVEIRLNDDKRKKMQIGDYIEFINNETGGTLLVEIIGKKVLDKVEDLYELYDEKSLGISKKNIVKTMEQIYTKEEIKNNKICAIEIIRK